MSRKDRFWLVLTIIVLGLVTWSGLSCFFGLLWALLGLDWVDAGTNAVGVIGAVFVVWRICRPGKRIEVPHE